MVSLTSLLQVTALVSDLLTFVRNLSEKLLDLFLVYQTVGHVCVSEECCRETGNKKEQMCQVCSNI